MWFLFDANLPLDLAHAIRERCSAEPGVDEVIQLSDRFRRGTPDLEWIPALGLGWYVISIDKFAKSRGQERDALRRANQTVCLLDSQWSKHPFWLKSSTLVLWWPQKLTVGKARKIQHMFDELDTEKLLPVTARPRLGAEIARQGSLRAELAKRHSFTQLHHQELFDEFVRKLPRLPTCRHHTPYGTHLPYRGCPMTKPYKDGKGYAIRPRFQGQDVFISGCKSGAAAMKQMDLRVTQLSSAGKPKGHRAQTSRGYRSKAMQSQYRI